MKKENFDNLAQIYHSLYILNTHSGHGDSMNHVPFIVHIVSSIVA